MFMNNLGNKVKAAPYLIPLYTRKSLASAPPACGGQPTNERRLTPVAATLAKSNRERLRPGRHSHNQRAGAGVITRAGYLVRLPVRTWLFLKPNLPGRAARTTAIGSGRVACLPASRLPAAGSRA
ncbi:hypothetical protein [Burkholderia gladioli]|uniref:hypothetical protein n=1 Tax=Burkholderia gladioli TaxID=28095 RepID=UPI00163FC5D1|nr:hypothetical protein [Burkholderia gladioli]